MKEWIVGLVALATLGMSLWWLFKSRQITKRRSLLNALLMVVRLGCVDFIGYKTIEVFWDRAFVDLMLVVCVPVMIAVLMSTAGVDNDNQSLSIDASIASL